MSSQPPAYATTKKAAWSDPHHQIVVSSSTYDSPSTPPGNNYPPPASTYSPQSPHSGQFLSMDPSSACTGKLAAQAVHVRLAFVRKVYLLLTLQLSFTFALSLIFYNDLSIQRWVQTTTWPMVCAL